MKYSYEQYTICLRADVSYFLCYFSACNKGNRRRLHAGNFTMKYSYEQYTIGPF